jgi:hypothetical protein
MHPALLRGLHSFPLLEAYRGSAKGDVLPLEDALAEDHPHIAEMDCNPVIWACLASSSWTLAFGWRVARRDDQ